MKMCKLPDKAFKMAVLMLNTATDLSNNLSQASYVFSTASISTGTSAFTTAQLLTPNLRALSHSPFYPALSEIPETQHKSQSNQNVP
jgi:hypothetical protein